MLARVPSALRQFAPRGARLLAQQADAVTPYRELASTTAAQREAWATQDELMHARMKEHVPAALEHNGEESFANHLVGVQSVLRSWNASETLCNAARSRANLCGLKRSSPRCLDAGDALWRLPEVADSAASGPPGNAALFHSIYGTEGFQGYKLPLSHREEIAELIGPEAERLAWIFCMVDRASVDETVLRPRGETPDLEGRSFRSRLELGAFAMPLTDEKEWLDFITLSLADWLEQVEGAARKANPAALWGEGEAWAYRRDGYAAMAELLGERGVAVAPRMYAEVFGREPAATRALVQPVTPPMSDAARDAYDALASAQWDMDGSVGSGAAEHELAWQPAPRQ